MLIPILLVVGGLAVVGGTIYYLATSETGGQVISAASQAVGTVLSVVGVGGGASDDLIGRWLAAIRRRLGRPWGWGTAGPDTYDCSGLLFSAAQEVGLDLPRVSGEMAERGQDVSEEQAKMSPGVLVVFRNTSSDEVGHIEVSTGRGTTLGQQTGAGGSEFGWGWWNSTKQKAIWNVSYRRLT